MSHACCIEAGQQSKKDKEEKEKTEPPAAAAAPASQQPVPESPQPKTVSGMCVRSALYC